MDLSTIWADLWKLGPLFAFMGAVIYIQYTRNKALEEKNDKLQEDKLGLTKALGDVTNVANRHIETSNEFMKELPQVFAAAIVDSRDKVISEMREIFRGQR